MTPTFILLSMIYLLVTIGTWGAFIQDIKPLNNFYRWVAAIYLFFPALAWPFCFAYRYVRGCIENDEE